MKLDIFLPCAVISEAGIVLSLFLIFANFEPLCSHKMVLIKKRVVQLYCNIRVYVRERGSKTKQEPPLRQSLVQADTRKDFQKVPHPLTLTATAEDVKLTANENSQLPLPMHTRNATG